jgi:sulfur transfer protein SufE
MAAGGFLLWQDAPCQRAMSIAETAADIREDFSWLEDWEARYAHIIDLGKANPPLEPHERTEETRVRGCASQVWLVTGWEDGKLVLRAESDAMIVSGLIALLSSSIPVPQRKRSCPSTRRPSWTRSASAAP